MKHSEETLDSCNYLIPSLKNRMRVRKNSCPVLLVDLKDYSSFYDGRSYLADCNLSKGYAASLLHHRCRWPPLGSILRR